MPKSRPIVVLSLILPLFLLTAGVRAEVVYKWTDEQGRVHFSDSPQDGAEALDLPGSPRYPSQRSEPPPEESDKAADAPPDPEQQAAAAAQQQEIRRKNCEIARQALQRNESLGRMYRIGADGQRHFLSDEERAAVLKSSRDDVAHWCD